MIASDSTNLRAIPRKENLSKGANSLFTAEILLANVTERNNNKIKIIGKVIHGVVVILDIMNRVKD